MALTGGPTSDVLKQRIADLEGGAAGLAAASGHAAQAQTIFTLANAGDHRRYAERFYS